MFLHHDFPSQYKTFTIELEYQTKKSWPNSLLHCCTLMIYYIWSWVDITYYQDSDSMAEMAFIWYCDIFINFSQICLSDDIWPPLEKWLNICFHTNNYLLLFEPTTFGRTTNTKGFSLFFRLREFQCFSLTRVDSSPSKENSNFPSDGEFSNSSVIFNKLRNYFESQRKNSTFRRVEFHLKPWVMHLDFPPSHCIVN